MVGIETVQVGSRVRIRDDGEEAWWQIVPAHEEVDPLQGRLSAETPMAKALLGARTGDKVQVRGPDRRTVTILDVVPDRC